MIATTWSWIQRYTLFHTLYFTVCLLTVNNHILNNRVLRLFNYVKFNFIHLIQYLLLREYDHIKWLRLLGILSTVTDDPLISLLKILTVYETWLEYHLGQANLWCQVSRYLFVFFHRVENIITLSNIKLSFIVNTEIFSLPLNRPIIINYEIILRWRLPSLFNDLTIIIILPILIIALTRQPRTTLNLINTIDTIVL